MTIWEAVLLLCLASVTCQKDLAAPVYVTKSVADWFKLSCVVFFHPNDVTTEEIQQIFQEFKIMCEGLKTVASRKFLLDTTVYRYNSQRCSQMLHVVDGRSEKSLLWLEKVSHSVNLRGPIWLVFLPGTPEEYLRNIYIPFDSNFIAVEARDLFILSQVYRVSMHHGIRTTPFGNWTPEEGLTVYEGYSPHWRRDDLEGKTFKVSAIESWPLATLTRDNVVGGYFGRVWKELQERLNFTTVYVKPKDFATGVWNDGKWNGLVGMISRGEIDAAISEITMTPERIPVIDFLQPLYTTRYQLFYKSPGVVIQWDLIFRPFQMEVWLTLIAWLALLTLLLNIGHRIGLKYALEDPNFRVEYEGYHCFFFVASAFSQQANAILPKSGFCRLILATAYMFSTVVLIIYSCILMSMIAVQKTYRPFNSLESFLEDGTYNLHQIPGTDAYAYFSEWQAQRMNEEGSNPCGNEMQKGPSSLSPLIPANSTDPLLQKIYQTQFSKLPEKDLPTSHRAALTRVCDSDKVAHLGEFGVAVLSADELRQKKGCDLVFLERPLKLLYLTMAVTKDSPYRDSIDYQLEQMAVTGILNRLRNMNFPIWRRKIHVSFQPVSIEQTAQMNLLFIAGSIAAVLAFVGETILKRCRQ